MSRRELDMSMSVMVIVIGSVQLAESYIYMCVSYIDLDKRGVWEEKITYELRSIGSCIIPIMLVSDNFDALIPI